MLIRVVPVGNISGKILEEVCAELREIFGAKCRLGEKLNIPKEAFNRWRKQYDAEKIIEILSKNPEVKFISKTIPSLLIISEDIYYDGLNFIFGLQTRGCCMISITRLRPEFYDQRSNFFIFRERVIKEAVHELGHYLGLNHCSHPWCVMCFSESIKQVDEKKKYFCKDCKIKLAMKGMD